MNHQVQQIKDLLATISEFVGTNGKLLMSNIRTAAKAYDDNLIRTLLEDDMAKEMFFRSAGGATIFDIDKFLWVINCQEFLKGSFTAYKQKIGLTDGNGDFISNNGDVVLSFPHKDCVLEFDSTDETSSANSETMLNEIIAKEDIDVLLDEKVFVNTRKIDENGESSVSVFEDDTDGILIKGNNLLALYSLLPRYEEKVKLMYWDILYNTSDDQVPYNDSFKHDTWLVMMKNRLEVAKRLLQKNGIICLQCDKNEDAYLKVLCDEIFGRENYVNTIAIKTSTPSGTKTAHGKSTIIKTKDTLLVYAKNMPIKVKPAYIARDNWDPHFTVWLEKTDDGYVKKSVKDKMLELGLIGEKDKIADVDITREDIKQFYIENAKHIGRWTSHKNKQITEHCLSNPNQIIEFFNDDGTSKGIYENKQMFSSIQDGLHTVLGKNKDEHLWSMLLCDIWTDIDFQNTQNEGGAASLPNGKKPEFLLRRIIDLFTEPGDLVLDAYLGSGTTAAVAHKMGRRYIGIEQLDKHMSMAIQRVNDVIHGEESGRETHGIEILCFLGVVVK